MKILALMAITILLDSWKQIKHWILKKPYHFFFMAVPIWLVLVLLVKSITREYDTFWGFKCNELLVEAFGMVFDLFVFGALLAWYDGKRKSREQIKQDNDLIDDLRGWKNEEGVRRTVGAIKRLNDEKVTDIILTNCFLQGAKLNNVNLQGANFQGAILKGAFLISAKLEGAIFVGANLREACLVHANLEGANFSWFEVEVPLFERTNLSGVNLKGACLLNADLNGADLQEVDLEDAIVGEGWFEKLETWGVIGKDEIKIKYQINEKGILKLK